MLLKVVICGTFHRETVGLARLFAELEATGCRILSPLTLDFNNANEEAFVRTATETDLSPYDIEKYHLRTIRDADLIWLYAPSGYVGLSGAFELGYAAALSKPIFTKELPSDTMLQNMVSVAHSVFDALEQLGR